MPNPLVRVGVSQTHHPRWPVKLRVIASDVMYDPGVDNEMKRKLA